MNLLYALSFFFAPPPEDLAGRDERQHDIHHPTKDGSDVLFFASLGDEAFAATRGAIDDYIRGRGRYWGEKRRLGELHVDQ